MPRNGITDLPGLLYREIQQVTAIHHINGIGNGCSFIDRNWASRHNVFRAQFPQIMTGSQGSQQVNLADETDDTSVPIDNRCAGRMVSDEVSPNCGGLLIKPEPDAIGWCNLTECFQSLRGDPWHSHSASSTHYKIKQMNSKSHGTLPPRCAPSGCHRVACRHPEDVSFLEVKALLHGVVAKRASSIRIKGIGPAENCGVVESRRKGAYNHAVCYGKRFGSQ